MDRPSDGVVNAQITVLHVLLCHLPNLDWYESVTHCRFDLKLIDTDFRDGQCGTGPGPTKE